MVDLTLELRDGRTIAHRPTCPQVQLLRDAFVPLMTLFGCDGKLPQDVVLHHCMEEHHNGQINLS